MKAFNEKIVIWISIGLAALALIVSVWNVCQSNITIDCKELEFSYDKLGTLIGIVLSSFSLVAAMFFIVLSFKAEHISRRMELDVEKARMEINEQIGQIQKHVDIISKKIGEADTTMYNLYSETIGLNRISLGSVGFQETCMILKGAECKHIEELKSEMNEQLTKLKIEQARFVCRSCWIDKEKKISAINQLSVLSRDKLDLELLKKIYDDITEDENVRIVANMAWIRLNGRLEKMES